MNEISDAAYHLGFTAKPSKFVQRVIELTCWGFLTWPAIQWLADALVEDFGDLHPEIVKISKAGCEGIYPSNIRRDILNFAKGSINFAKPIKVPLPCLVKKKGKAQREVGTVQYPIIFPHVIIDCLQKDFPDKWRSLIDYDLTKFWNCVPEDDPKLFQHPMMELPEWKSRAAPLILHGDEVPFTKHGKLHVVSFSVLTSLGTTWDDTFLGFAFPTDCACHEKTHGRDTYWTLWKWYAHSLNQAFYGELLPHDPFGVVWDPVILAAWVVHTTHGTYVVARSFGVVWILAWDLEYGANDIKMLHFNSNRPCNFCGCDRRACSVRAVGPAAPWKRRLVPVGAPHPSNHPVWSIVGTSRFNNPGDLMHTGDLGVLLHIEGSSLWQLVHDGPLVGTITQKVAILDHEIKDIYHELGITHRLPPLELKMFQKKRGYHFLTAKAAHARFFLPVMVKLCQRHYNGSPRDGHRLVALQTLQEIYSNIMQHGFFLPHGIPEKLLTLADSFLMHY